MMNAFLLGIRQQVIDDAGSAALPDIPYLRTDAHTAVSLLQKAIRRSRTNWALSAAQRVFDIQPTRLWRRLGITLFEDVGILDEQLALDVLACAPRRDAAQVPWPVVATLVRRLCDAPKTQVANNLLHLGIVDLTETGAMEHLAFVPIDEASQYVVGEPWSLVQRARAVWQLSGVACTGWVPRHPDSDRERTLSLLAEIAPGTSMEIIAREGLRVTEHVLPLVSVLEAAATSAPTCCDVAPDLMPPERVIAGLPTWVFDQYTRAGKAALRIAQTECPAIASDLKVRAATGGQRYRALADAHFEYESANLARRAQIPAHIALWRRAQGLGAHRRPEDAERLYGALRADWGAFLGIRERAVKHQAHDMTWRK
ncbi:MAG: hypothetical protein JJU18_05695 [Oceanicaulis sp.]|nr:hypothetical protein [Oceanicaulis sp.]